MSSGGESKLSVLASMLNWIQRSKTSTKKRSKFRKYLDTFCNPNDYFSSIRLILPSLDRERGSYGLKESVLATCLIDALGISKDSEDALRLINWRKGGPKTGAAAGNFSLVATEVLQRRQGTASGGLTIRELNELLDRLASSDNRAEKAAVLATLINKTNAQEMKWIIMIILKDLKMGISEKSIFHEFHPDAEDLFNVTCDLKLVCEKLKDRSQRHKRQDIEVGKPVRPQLAMRIANANAAWKKLHGKEVVVECKFDGDRIQIHKNGTDIHYFSRNFFDHSEYEHGMSNIIMENVLVDRCIIDGEMLVWDTSLNRFAEFGSNQEIAKAARDGLDSDRQGLNIIYVTLTCYSQDVAFDILYVGDTSVIHQNLKERHELMRKVVKPLQGRLEINVPNGGMNIHRPPGTPNWSLLAYSVDDVEKFFKETIENRDEGIVVKDLDSKWEPGDRSAKWMKLKPEYVHPSSDLDVLIIGGYYGSGRHGGEVAQFLLGLAEPAAPNTYPRRFISFCRVGTGLSDDELNALVTKLKPYFRKNEHPKKSPPSFYQVTNHSKERPDVWIESPEKSVILSITSDIRTITSDVFSAPYSLRFPRIDKVRYDKPWHECLDLQSFIDLVHSSNGNTKKGTEHGDVPHSKAKATKTSKKGERKKASIVPSHFVQTDVSSVKGETLIFSNMVFYFVNVPSTYSLESMHTMVVENGGTFSMNLNNSVTHRIAAESRGIKYQAAKLRGDVIHYSWFLECCAQKKLLPLQPRCFLSLSESTKKKLEEEVDEYSDSYYWDLDLADFKQLLTSIDRSEDAKTVELYKKKYCPKEKWSTFNGCCIYFSTLPQNLKSEWEFLLGLAMRRLKLEVLMGGGSVSNNLAHATHLVVYSLPGVEVDFDSLAKSFAAPEKKFLGRKKLHVVRYQWLEDCLASEQTLPEDEYSLKPTTAEESSMIERLINFTYMVPSEEDDRNLEEASSPKDCAKNQTMQSLPVLDVKHKEAPHKNLPLYDSSNIGERRKRGRPAEKRTKKGKVVTTQPRKVRPRLGKKAAKMYENNSDEHNSSDDATKEQSPVTEGQREIHDTSSGEKEQSQLTGGQRELHDTIRGENSEHPGDRGESEIESLRGSETVAPELAETRQEELLNKASPEVYGQASENPDPIQAMLFNMIPSLRSKKAETSNSIVEDLKPPADPSTEGEDVNAEPPVKKKKVSYKDVVGDLLKDW
ncbi:hypothetical protein ACFE04_028118 [Oxalis oulophora]